MSLPATPSSPTASAAPSPAGGAPFDFITWFELNRGRILLGVGVVCAVVIATMVVRARRQAEMRTAAGALLALKPAETPGQPAPTPDPQKLLELSRKFPGTPAAAQARLLAAGQLFVAGKYPEAQTEFAAVETAQPDGPLLGIALLGVASSLDAQNKGGEAVAAYDRVISLFPSDPVSVQARLAKSRLVQGSQPAQALGLLDEILRNEYAIGYQELAVAARSRLLAEHPELDVPLVTTNQIRVLAPTNPPPADAPAQ
ncbi:MAG: tetratricopeptide repeat protein [Verrucomicrobiae bacterium]|nr:tetratricopeptide repeat protein [Verrucomicrobiae bacterium]